MGVTIAAFRTREQIGRLRPFGRALAGEVAQRPAGAVAGQPRDSRATVGEIDHREASPQQRLRGADRVAVTFDHARRLVALRRPEPAIRAAAAGTENDRQVAGVIAAACAPYRTRLVPADAVARLLNDRLRLRLRGRDGRRSLAARRQPQLAAHPFDRAPDLVDLLLVGAGLVAATGEEVFEPPQLRVQDLVPRRFGGFTSPGFDASAVGHGATLALAQLSCLRKRSPHPPLALLRPVRSGVDIAPAAG